MPTVTCGTLGDLRRALAHLPDSQPCVFRPTSPSLGQPPEDFVLVVESPNPGSCHTGRGMVVVRKGISKQDFDAIAQGFEQQIAKLETALESFRKMSDLLGSPASLPADRDRGS